MTVELSVPVIKSIELINFMCHSHLQVDFKKPLTIITGRNGSGKSAVMVAIGIVFGQRANSLERGNSLKELIKTNENISLIRIILNNKRCFKKDFFEDTIIVEKKITVKNSLLSIMNDKRKVWSTKKDDLEHMLDFLSIKFDNPLSFLTQEHSKRFLNLSQPENLYDFFMKGTEISEISKLNEISMEEYKLMSTKIEENTFDLENINEKADKLTETIEIIKNKKRIEDDLKNLKIEMEWSKINEIKKSADEKFNVFLEAEKEMDIKKEELNENTKKIIKLRMEASEEESKEITRQKLKEDKINEVTEKILKLEKKRIGIEGDKKELLEIKDFKDKIIKDFEKRSGMVEDKRPKLIMTQNSLAEETEELKDRMEILENEQRELQEEKRKEDEIINEKNSKIYNLKKQINYYSKIDKKTFLHPNLSDILNDISKTEFSERVIGPIANYIELKETKWSKVANIVLNKVLNNFIVTNRYDKSKLIKIFRKYRANFTILMPSNKSMAPLKIKKNSEFKTLYDVLNIKDQLVENQLIIITSLEQMILLDNRNLAYQVIKNRPINVDCAYTQNGDKIKLLANNSLSDFVVRNMERGYFDDTEKKLEYFKQELKKQEESIVVSDISEKIKDLLDEIRQISGRINVNQRSLESVTKEIEYEEESLKMQKEVVNEEDMYTEVESLKNQINILNKKSDEIKIELDNLNLEEKLLRDDKPIESLDLRTEINKEIQNKLRIENNINNINTKLQYLKSEHFTILKKYEIAKNELKAKLNSNGAAEEIVSPRSLEEIRRCIVKLEAKKDMIVVTNEENEILKKLEGLKKNKEIKEKLILEYKKNMDNNIRDINMRIEKRDKLKNNMSEKATKVFNEITAKRGYVGDLSFDHEKRHLNLKMKVHGNSESGSKNTLSGGERSFAGVALLFSLWPFLSCPVMVLDEFDVFMDELNRKEIINQFLDFFKKSSLQAILITPLSTEALAEDHCEVIVLERPKRDD